MAEQLDFPYPLDQKRLTVFLAQWVAIEDQLDRLREELRLLKGDYGDAFPMRGVLTAIKIVRARQKLADHAKEPMRPAHLAYLEALVEDHLLQAPAEVAEVVVEEGIGTVAHAWERFPIGKTIGLAQN
jgi:hypothetical protein